MPSNIIPPHHLFEIQEANRTTSGDGTTASDWKLVTKEWGQIKPIRGRERIEAKKIQSKVSHRIFLRYVEGITTEHRLILKPSNRVFDIDAVLNVDEADAQLEIEAVELV